MPRSIFAPNPRSRRHRQTAAPAEKTAAEQVPFFQPKLTVNQPGDQHERQADDAADRAVQRLATPEEEKMPATNDARMAEDKKIQEKPDAESGQKEDEKAIQKMDAPAEKEDEKAIQKMDAPQPSAHFAAQLAARRGSGKPLPAPARAKMERAMAADFSRVRIHDDPQAAAMCAEIGAQAFASGCDIYFGNGKFRPESADGERLLAHELAHVIQQTGRTEALKTEKS